jgi:mannitol/fructose-specific phosphotransferase system IIA component (Ntr-type)
MERGRTKLSATVTAARLADIFKHELVVLGLQHRTKHAVIAELVQRLVAAGCVDAASETSLTQLIIAREDMGTTALGNGIAMPHCRTSMTEQFIGVVAVDSKGIDFGALDGQPVHLVFLLLGPLDQRERLFDILGRISSFRQDKTIRTQFRGCRSTADVTSLLEDLDNSYG